MALIGSINGIPLFTIPQEAIAWAVANGTTGFHEHMFEGQVGYMGGTSHADILVGEKRKVKPNTNRLQQTTTRTSSSPSGSGSSGSSGYSGGGGGGY